MSVTCAVLDAMRKVDPGADRGALVAFRDLWPVCESAGLSRENAERQVLTLARSGQLCLHKADRCDQAQADLPAGLVIGDSWYVGCHVRQTV